MNEFWVVFASGTTFDQITAGLKNVGATNISEEDGVYFFDADWGITPKDLNNLKGKIEAKSGRNSVEDIGVQDDSSKRRSSAKAAT